MRIINTPHAVLFDFDGTLVESEGIWLEAKINALHRIGIFSSEAELKEFAGKNLSTVFSYFFSDLVKNKTEGELEVIRENFYNNVDSAALDLIPDYLKEIQGARETLVQFKEAGFVIAICSNAPTYFIDSALTFLKMNGIVDAVFSSANTNKGKPDPYVYNQAIDALAVDKKQTIAVEDSESGTTAALAAGIDVILIKNSLTSDSRKGVYTAKSIKEVTPNFIKNIFATKAL